MRIRYLNKEVFAVLRMGDGGRTIKFLVRGEMFIFSRLQFFHPRSPGEPCCLGKLSDSPKVNPSLQLIDK